MKLKFKLQALMLLREQRREQALLQYARSIKQTNTIRKKYEDLQQKLKNCEAWQSSKDAFSIQQHVSHLQQLAHLNTALKSVGQHLNLLKREEQKQRKIYLEAKKEVKILEKLKGKLQQRELDNIALCEARESENWIQACYKR